MTDIVKLHIIDREGKNQTIDAEVGATLKDAVLKAIPMLHFGDCGGCCACATCHMYIDSGWKWAVNGMDIDEKEMLETAEEVNETSRLGCQLQVNPEMDGLTITIAQSI